MTDNVARHQNVTENVIEVALDCLAVGIDPTESTILIQSQVRELAEQSQYLLDLVTVARLERNPTMKDEIRLWGFERDIPVGFLTRRAIARAAWEAKLAPTDISFERALHTIQYELMWAALTPSYGKLPACLRRLREGLGSLPNEKRPGRACDRVVKSRPSRYSVRYLRKDPN